MSAPAAEKEYVGGCHCGKFRFKFTNAPFEDGAGNVDRCTCGFCTQKGALWLYVSSLFMFAYKALTSLFADTCPKDCSR